MDYKDYYATLGVDRKASKAEIQKAYKKLARKLHPDVNKTPEAEARFKEITEANEVLKNEEKRAKYDQFGSAWQQSQRTGGPPPGFEDIFSSFGQGGGARGFQASGSGFSSFFEALFGGGGGGGQAWQHAGGGHGVPGADHEASISLSLEDAAKGGEREITVGAPSLGRNRRLRVRVPAGVRSGQRIRLGGQGGQSSMGGPSGDLYLKVQLLPHPRFSLDGDKLRAYLDVSPAQAALGGEAEIATLNGSLRVRIPPGSSSGRKIRLRGKGYPAGKAFGDLIAEIRIVVPGELTKEERTLYQQLAELSLTDTPPEEPTQRESN